MPPKPRVLAVNPRNPDRTVIEEAANVLRVGGLVAFPTETVYGLGADGTNPAALKKIFEAKGRPSTNPLILHVSSPEMARLLVTHWPVNAQKLADAFWPGPLSLVLPRSNLVPDLITAGESTVAIRMPQHPVALQLISRLERPIAAPSANRSMSLSPTQAHHVVESLGAAVDLVLDAGPATVGIESSVVDLTTPVPTLLRPGWLTPAMIQQATGIIIQAKDEAQAGQIARSPGQMLRHYAPATPVSLIEPFELPPTPENTALLIIGHPNAQQMPGPTLRRLMTSPTETARDLYAQLHEWDRLGLRQIYIVPPPVRPEWDAILDRLNRAATPLGQAD